MIKFNTFKEISEDLQYHIDKELSLEECVHRMGSKKYFDLFVEARKMWEEKVITVDERTEWFLEKTDLGEWGDYEGMDVPLDCPMATEAFQQFQEAEYKGKEVQLNKPSKGGPKKFQVFVKNDKGNVIRVAFGDPNMSVKLDDEGARKNFAARHNCASKKDKTTPGYWSCNLPRYAGQLGLKGGGSFFW